MGISLPALSIRPPEQQAGPLEQFGKVLQLKSLLAQQQSIPVQQQIQQEQLSQEHLQTQQLQKQQADSQTIQDVLSKNGGDLSKSLPVLSGKIQAERFIGLVKADKEMQADARKKTNEELDIGLKQNNALQGLLDQAKALPPDQYQQMYPQIAAQAKQIKPDLQIPDQPIPQQALGQFEIGLQTHTQYQANEAAQRAQQKQDEIDRHNREMEDKNPSESGLAFRAAGGDKQAQSALSLLEKQKAAGRPVNNIMTPNDAKDIADSIESGDQPPTLQGLYRNAGPVRAELARRGFPLAQAETDWKAVQKHIQTLNGSQQERLRQSIGSLPDMLDKVDGLFQEWQKLAPQSGFKVLNKATLAAMKNVPGRAGAVATALDAQIGDVVADLGTVYMGGNSPTDHALGLASKQLSSDWNAQSFAEGLKQARENVKIRKAAILNSQPVGVSAGSPYLGQQTQQTQQPAAQPGGFSWDSFPKHQ